MTDLKTDIDSGVAVVTIHRPEVRNALRVETIEELRTTLEELRRSKDVGAVIFTGAGDASFVAGRDIKDLYKLTKLDALEHRLSNLFREIETFEKPTLAAVNGYALGGGLEFALCCDIRIASENAVLGLPETKLNIIPAAGGTQRLPRVVGIGIAKDMILTGKLLDARRAFEVGLVSEVVPPAKLLESAKDLAKKIVERGPLATRLAKLTLNMSQQTAQDAGLMIERLAQAILFESKDKVEGVSAFLEKRKPKFTGE
jgi:enoyl-CoA hydratase